MTRFLPVLFLLLLCSCRDGGGPATQEPEPVRDSSCVQFTNEAFIRQLHGEHVRKGRSVQVYVQLFAITTWEEGIDWEAIEQGLKAPPGEFKWKKELKGKYKAFREHYARELEVVSDGGYYYGNAGVNLTRKRLLWLYFNGLA